MAECRLVIIKRNGEDLTDQLLAPETEWKIGKSVTADIRVRIDGVEEEHGIIKVDKSGKVCVLNFSADNPLMVNGKPFRKEHVVKNGDHLSIINRSFRFDIKDPVLQQVTSNVPQLTSTPDQRTISGIENYRSSPRPTRSRRSTPGTVGVSSRIATPIPSGSLYKSWRSSLSVTGSSLDKIQEDGEEGTDGDAVVPDVQQCLFAEEKEKTSDGAAANKPRRSTRRSSIRRSVAFGPALSPEYFDKSLPPNTPLKKGTLPPNSFIAEQPPNELEQIVEEEEVQNSYSELFSTSGKARKSPTPKKKETKTKSPKQSTTPIQEGRRSAIKKAASPVKGTNKIRKSYGGVTKKSTKQKRSSLPASVKQITAVVSPGKMKSTEDTTDGAALVKLKPKEGKEVHTPKTKKMTKKDESIKKLGSVKKDQLEPQSAATFSASNRSFVIKGGKGKASKNRKSLPSSVLMEGASDTSVIPYVSVFPTEDVPALPQEQSLEVSTDDELEEESEIRLSLPTPLKKSIQGGVSLRQTKPKLWTPLRIDLENGVVLRKLHQALPTPLRQAIASNPILRVTKKALATPLRKEIEGQPKLHATKKALATPLRKEIEGQPKLRATKKALATPLRKEIEGQPKLRATKKALATPLRKEIEGQPKLRATKKALATPLRKEIEGQPKLRATKKALATPLRKEIEGQPQLRATKKKMATPLRIEIMSKPKLRATKRTMPTPLRKDIKSRPKLKAVMKSLPTPLKEDLKKTWNLRQTKPRMPTPLQESIKEKPKLKKVMKSLPTPIRKEIESQPSLKQTKKMLPLPVREEILQHPPLKSTKRRMATPLRQAIENPPPLKVTKKSEDTPSTERRAPKRRQSKGEDDLPPKKKAKAVAASNEDKSPPVEYGGIQRLFKETSKTKDGIPQGDAVYQGVQRMFRTPRSKKNLSPDYEGLVDLFSTPMILANVTSKKVKFLSPVAMSAKRSTRSRATVNSSLVLNVPKLDYSENKSVRRTRSKVASLPPALENPSPIAEPTKEKTSQKRAKPRAQKSDVISTVPELEDSVPAPVIRSLRSRGKSLTLPVDEVAPVAAKKKGVTQKKKTKAENEETKEVPVPVATKRPTRAAQPVKSPNTSPVRRTRRSKAINQEVSEVEVKTSTKKRKAPLAVVENNMQSVSPVVVRRTRRSQMTEQEVTTVDTQTNTRKRKAPPKHTESDVESVNVNPVVRRTRSQMTVQEEVATVEIKTVTKKRKTSQKVTESNVENITASPVVRRTRRSQMTEQTSVPVTAEPKKVAAAKRKVQEVKGNDTQNEIVSPLVTRTRQNQIIKVIVPVKTKVMSTISESQEQITTRHSTRLRRKF